jgi:cytochrome c peroxidase
MKTISKWASLALLLAGGLQASAPGQESLVQQARRWFSPLPEVFVDAANPQTPEKVALGKMLFYDTRVSVDGTVSCFKCHWLNLYGTDGLKTAIGNRCRSNPRNSPTVLNAAGQISEHWLGNRKSVEDQAEQALLGAGSYGLSSYAEAETKILAIPGYEALFKAAFPGQAHPVTAANFGRAIGAYERTLATPSRFDIFLAKDNDALEPAEKQGLAAFIGAGCAACHNGAPVGGQMYRKFGIQSPYWGMTKSVEVDKGRFDVTHNEADLYVFKVPPLRNVRMTAPYFHDGSVARLDEAVRIMASVQLGRTLSDSQVAEILIFLDALTGTIPTRALVVPANPRMK